MLYWYVNCYTNSVLLRDWLHNCFAIKQMLQVDLRTRRILYSASHNVNFYTNSSSTTYIAEQTLHYYVNYYKNALLLDVLDACSRIRPGTCARGASCTHDSRNENCDTNALPMTCEPQLCRNFHCQILKCKCMLQDQCCHVRPRFSGFVLFGSCCPPHTTHIATQMLHVYVHCYTNA